MEVSFEKFLKNAAAVKPSPRQMEWFDTEFYAFIHFTVNTYTGLEWGTGQESPEIFNPAQLDCDEWVEAIKSAGAKGLVLTAKHHDGFCLWPSEYTEHSVKNSPYKNGKGDIVREAADACRRGGIKFGVYLSPWDRNSKLYGTEQYNDYYSAQLTELLTNYGELFMVWQDNACGEGPNGIKQTYDFERFNALVRKYQPGACIFNDYGPDVRWCGNEGGASRNAEWAVVPSELCTRAEWQTNGQAIPGTLAGINCMSNYIGSLSNIIYSEGLVFTGSEIDMSIRPGWFYHPEQQPHSLERLFDTYLRSVGHNACFHLNIPPMPNGRFDQRDIKRLHELGRKIQDEFSRPVKATWEKTSANISGQCVYTVNLEKESEIRYIVLSEDISKGQRIENFQINVLDYRLNPTVGDPMCKYSGDTIGHKQICVINDYMKEKTFTIMITSTRDEVFLKDIIVYE